MHILHHSHKLERDKGLECKTGTLELLEENIGGKMLPVMDLGNDILDMTPKVFLSNKTKNKQAELHQIKSFCKAKEIISKMKA